MMTFKPRIIKNDSDYDMAMERLSELIELCPAIDTPEGDELEHISILIEHYENKNFQVDKPSAIDAIKFRMDQDGLTPKDMVAYLGSRSKVSEVLNGKRRLSKAMMKKLNSGLGIPLDILIQSADDLPEPDVGDLIRVAGSSDQEQENLQWGESSSVGKLQELVISVPPTCDKSVMQ